MKYSLIDIRPPRKFKEEKLIIKKEKKKFVFRFPRKSYLILINLLVFLLTVFILSTIFGNVTIKISPIISQNDFSLDFSFDTTISNSDSKMKILAGKIFESEEVFSNEFDATGKIKKEEKATGIVRIFNDYNKDQFLVSNTRLQAPIEKFNPPLEKNENPWFRTTENVIVPAKGYVDVKVVADSPGEKYNIGPATFSIPGLVGTPQYSFIYGKSFEPMKGGKIGEIKKVTKEDLQKAENELKQQVEREAVNILATKIPKEYLILKDQFNLQILEKKPLAKEGDEVEKFGYQMKVKLKGVAIQNEDVKKLILDNFSQIFPDKEFLKDTLNFDLKVTNFSFEDGKGRGIINVNLKTYPRLSIEELKNTLKGMSIKEAQIVLKNQPQIKNASIKVFPFWLTKIPSDLNKIKIIWPLID
jgi:hypothetical protein